MVSVTSSPTANGHSTTTLPGPAERRAPLGSVTSAPVAQFGIRSVSAHGRWSDSVIRTVTAPSRG